MNKAEQGINSPENRRVIPIRGYEKDGYYRVEALVKSVTSDNKTNVNFLIDTGAKFTVLNAPDARRLYLDLTKRKKRMLSGFEGTKVPAYKFNAEIWFEHEDAFLSGFQTELLALGGNNRISSVLGRDILKLFDLRIFWAQTSSNPTRRIYLIPHL